MSKSEKSPVEGCEKRSGFKQLGQTLPGEVFAIQKWPRGIIVFTSGGAYELEADEWVPLR